MRVAFVLPMLFVVACASRPPDPLAESVGRVLIVDAKYLGTIKVPEQIDAEYQQTIRKLPAGERAKFFFTLAIKAHLDGGFAHEFSELIAMDCPNEFLELSDQFILRFGEYSGELAVVRARDVHPKS